MRHHHDYRPDRQCRDTPGDEHPDEHPDEHLQPAVDDLLDDAQDTAELVDAPRQQRRCRFPGCSRPAKAPNPRGGRPPAYCSDPTHNKASRFALTQADPTRPDSWPGSTDRDTEARFQRPTQFDQDGRDNQARPPWASGLRGDVLESPDPDVASSVGAAAALRRAECAEALAADRARRLEDTEARAERREAELVERLLEAREEIATLRAELGALQRIDAPSSDPINGRTVPQQAAPHYPRPAP